MSEKTPARRLDQTIPVNFLKSRASYRTFVSEG